MYGQKNDKGVQKGRLFYLGRPKNILRKEEEKKKNDVQQT